MPLSNSALRAQLGNSLKALQQSLHALADHIRTEAGEAWIWHRPNTQSTAFDPPPPDLPRAATLKHIALAIEAIKYEDGQDPHESRIFPGILAVGSRGIALVDEVNRHKVALAEVLRQMEGRSETGTLDVRTGERGERPLREVALEAFYFRRLHHWQATRRLEVLRPSATQMSPPEYVGFMWATSREVRKTSREEILGQINGGELLALSDDEHAAIERLPAGEPLAWVQPGHTAPKANIRWPAAPGQKPIAKVRMAVMPLFMLGEKLPQRLRKLPLSPTPRHLRLPRMDTEIETDPFLPGLSLYRYLERHRLSKRPPTKSD